MNVDGELFLLESVCRLLILRRTLNKLFSEAAECTRSLPGNGLLRAGRVGSDLCHFRNDRVIATCSCRLGAHDFRDLKLALRVGGAHDGLKLPRL